MNQNNFNSIAQSNLANNLENPFNMDLGRSHISGQNVEQKQDTHLAQLWKFDEMKNYLIDKIKDRKLKGEIDMEKKISDKMLITEYWRYWLTLDDKDKLKKIYSYPSLSNEDYSKLNRIVEQEKASQFYWASGCSAVTLGCYKLFWAKKKRFYNFYRRPAPTIFGRKIPGYRAVKVGSSLLFLQMFWIISTNYFFNKSIPNKINESGYFSKYAIDVEKRNF